MDLLYDLSFFDDDLDHEEGFFIGLFRTAAEAEAVAARYLREVPGFREYDCTPRVTAFRVIGGEEEPDRVFRFAGWNEDEERNETEIVISSCFGSRADAQEALARAKEDTPREQWALNAHTIGQCDWAEGFDRGSDEA